MKSKNERFFGPENIKYFLKTQVLIIGLILSIVLIVGCSQQKLIGGDKDSHGCLIAAGYSWCDAKQKCIRPWEENCTSKECGTCPSYSYPPLSPEFCTNGTIVYTHDECGCVLGPTCQTGQTACTQEAKICPDGSAVGRTGPNCEFAPCPNSTQMANPASVFCEKQGGTSKIITAADGSQSGVCTLPSGIECDEWAYFRGECPVPHNCTETEKAQIACTLEYMPVCGDDGVIYGNKCGACASNKINSYTPGECLNRTYVTRDPEQCKVIKYLCIKGKQAFTDEFGCGCEPVTG